MTRTVLIAILISLSISNVNIADCLLQDSLGKLFGTFAAIRQYCSRLSLDEERDEEVFSYKRAPVYRVV